MGCSCILKKEDSNLDLEKTSELSKNHSSIIFHQLRNLNLTQS